MLNSPKNWFQKQPLWWKMGSINQIFSPSKWAQKEKNFGFWLLRKFMVIGKNSTLHQKPQNERTKGKKFLMQPKTIARIFDFFFTKSISPEEFTMSQIENLYFTGNFGIVKRPNRVSFRYLTGMTVRWVHSSNPRFRNFSGSFRDQL